MPNEMEIICDQAGGIIGFKQTNYQPTKQPNNQPGLFYRLIYKEMIIVSKQRISKK